MSEKLFELCDNAPPSVVHTANLISWCEYNYNFPAPSSLFLDLIGYSEEHLGEDLCRDKKPALGYLEIDLLAKALEEYAERPHEVMQFVESIFCDSEED